MLNKKERFSVLVEVHSFLLIIIEEIYRYIFIEWRRILTSGEYTTTALKPLVPQTRATDLQQNTTLTTYFGNFLGTVRCVPVHDMKGYCMLYYFSALHL